MNKKSEIKERMLGYAHIQRIKKAVFFEKLQCSPSNFSVPAIFSDPSTGTIANFLNEYSEVSPDWLILGKGKMLRNEDNLQQCSNCGSILYPNSPASITIREQDSVSVSEEVADYANSAKHMEDYERKLQMQQQEIAMLHAKILKIQEERIREQQEMLKHFSNLLANK